jgi:hypothetical protein
VLHLSRSVEIYAWMINIGIKKKRGKKNNIKDPVEAGS